MMREWLGAASGRTARVFSRAGRWCAVAAEFFSDLSEWFETSTRWRDLRDERRGRADED